MKLYLNCLVRVSVVLVVVFLSDCSLRKQSDGDSDHPGDSRETGKNRPDSQGVPPKTQYILGATFSRAEVGESSDRKQISIPNFPEQSCYFTKLFNESKFHWRFATNESSLLDRKSLDIDMGIEGLPASGQTFTLDKMMDSVTLSIPNLTSGIPGYWHLDAMSPSSSCSLQISRVLKADGTPAEAHFTGPFRMDASMSCKLTSFDFVGSKLLSFDVDVGCTGDVEDRSSSGSSMSKWFIEDSKVFELQTTPMASSLARGFCGNKTFKSRLPTKDELERNKDEIRKEMFASGVIPALWAADERDPSSLSVVTNLDKIQPTAVQPTSTTMASVICVR